VSREKGKKAQLMNGDKHGRLTKKAAHFVVLAVIVLALSSCSWFGSSKSSILPPKSIEVLTPKDCGLPYCEVNLNRSLWLLSNPTIYVYKNERRLLVVDDKVLVRDYPIALGPQPKGDKCMRGDGRTPEGDFFICVKNPSSKYHKGLGLNYPSPRHADEAYSLGVISKDEYVRIIKANERKTLPPDNTCLGGDIFIHGGGPVGDWTLGCVALRNSDVDELYDTIPVGTPVKIMP
jgi:murein L,D-transpeptidase YafK